MPCPDEFLVPPGEKIRISSEQPIPIFGLLHGEESFFKYSNRISFAAIFLFVLPRSLFLCMFEEILFHVLYEHPSCSQRKIVGFPLAHIFQAE